MEAAWADVALRSSPQDSVKEKISSQADMTDSPEQLAGKSLEILQLSAKHVELTNELSCVKSQNRAVNTVPEDSIYVAGACVRLAKHAKMAPRRKGFFSTTSTLVILALLTE